MNNKVTIRVRKSTIDVISAYKDKKKIKIFLFNKKIKLINVSITHLVTAIMDDCYIEIFSKFLNT